MLGSFIYPVAWVWSSVIVLVFGEGNIFPEAVLERGKVCPWWGQIRSVAVFFKRSMCFGGSTLRFGRGEIFPEAPFERGKFPYFALKIEENINAAKDLTLKDPYPKCSLSPKSPYL